MSDPATHDRTANRLAESTSPYLLQHKYNPVDWYPWGEEAISKAKKEGKLLLISIGYSACHWCHVMERESFEDEEVAELMNAHFVCVKVDREERPDIDQVYMNAVQLMTGRGGWPLNCIALPDGRPIYGGTYFPKAKWMQILDGLQRTFVENASRVHEYAEELLKGLQQQSKKAGLSQADGEEGLDTLQLGVDNWKKLFDPRDGGMDRAPKFPLPDNQSFLLRYAVMKEDADVQAHVHLTLEKMALGGLYDQIGGGFTRYSTDHFWKVPHFEKMLYDNAQLIQVYADAYRQSGRGLYRRVIGDTVRWLEREMKDDKGGYYSAIDADSEGVEGLFYTWSEEELKEALDADEFTLANELFRLDAHGEWESRYILLKEVEEEQLARMLGRGPDEFIQATQSLNEKLLLRRNTRIRPGLDDKVLCSWNAMCISGLCSAYDALGDKRYLNLALDCAKFLWSHMRRNDGGWNRVYKAGHSHVNAFLDDYAFLIKAALDLYSVTFDMDWITKAEALLDYVDLHFLDTEAQDYRYTSDLDEPLIIPLKEVQDNVVPSSNAVMAEVLSRMGRLLDKPVYVQRAKAMLARMQEDMRGYMSAASHWAALQLSLESRGLEVAFLGAEALSYRADFMRHFHADVLLAGATDEQSDIPMLKDKHVKGETLIYVCQHQSCSAPVESVEEALALCIQAP